MPPLRRRPAQAGLLLACCLWQAAAAAPRQTGTAADYLASLQQASSAVQACRSNAAACDANRVGPDLLVKPGNYTASLGWLRVALTRAHGGQTAARQTEMDCAAGRLRQELAFAGAPDAPDRLETSARAKADLILQGREFRSVTAAPPWWQQLSARFFQWLSRVLLRAAIASSHRPWIGLLVEWTLLAAALAGLLVYVLRGLRQPGGPREPGWQPRFSGDDQDSDWVSLAQAAADAGHWRDAVHALYWAAVAQLTAAGRWRQAAPRTPREYLRLLEPASPQRAALGTLTALLERVWYAGRPAAERDYLQARELAGGLGVAAVASQPAGRSSGAP